QLRGKTDSTQAFLSAWAGACGSFDSAIIYVPPGRYLLNQARFNGNCKNTNITIRIDGTLVAPTDYRVIGNAGTWLLFDKVIGVSIYGGSLDGQGSDLWACKAAGNTCPTGATNLGFTNLKYIVINGLTSLNSQIFHIVIDGCNNVNIQGVTVAAAGNSPNTDGIHVQMSTGVTIIGASIKTGDDCISIGPGTSTLWIERISCGPGHGISIGSLGKTLQEPGVLNMTVKNVTFTGSENGFRKKSWGRPSNGFARGILFQDAIMQNVDNPIVIDQNYCLHEEDCPGKVQYYKGHFGKVVCYPCSYCGGIILEDVQLTYQNQQAESSCVNAGGIAYGVVEPSNCL
ncbi:polygalacturonase-like, partial [Telopea speciosissima]|uniref:polygalacturonase-like n=1 Tax=Telopea speciosissima TaxID=54955 RepID=UPI001CC7597A